MARNRARRLLREAVRRSYAHIAAGYDIVLVARSGVLAERSQQVEAALRTVLERANLVSSAHSADEPGVTL